MSEEKQHHPDEPIQIDAKHDGDRIVVLTSVTEDRFVKTCQWLVETTKLGISHDVWLRELHQLLTYVRHWAEARADRVRSCFAAQRDSEMAIYVVPRSNRFDFDLSDELTQLDLELAEKFQACPCDVLQIPDEARDRLEDLAGHRLAVHIYGDTIRTQRQVAP